MITIVESGAGNLGSIRNMFRKLGEPSRVTNDPGDVRVAGKLVLPGVGAFDKAMYYFRERKLLAALDEAVLERRVPILGICLGMQLFSSYSEEGQATGFGWLEATTRRFRFERSRRLKVPHMGWNEVRMMTRHPLFFHMEKLRFYFAHSYYVECADPRLMTATTEYGFDFCSVVHQENIVGTQFHPEKSHQFGLKLLRNFVDWTL